MRRSAVEYFGGRNASGIIGVLHAGPAIRLTHSRA